MSPELAIRSSRAVFNKALMERDLASIAPLLSPGVILVAGTDSALISGRKAQLDAWRREFGWAERTIYERIPVSIVVSPVKPIALEQGEWSGVSASNGLPVASGIYSAKWQRSGANWLIEAEMYVTMA